MHRSNLARALLLLTLLACGSSDPSDATTADDDDAGIADTSDAGDTGDDGNDASASGDGSNTGDGSSEKDAGKDAEAELPACATQPFPTACTADATTSPAAGDYGMPGPHAVTIETLANPRASAPLPISIYRPTGLTSVPVVFISHAFGATKVAAYDELLRRIAENGMAAVYVPYATLNVTNAERYADLWEGFTAAVAAYGTTFDLTHVGFVGHSFGGGATPEMARRGFVENGWGSAGRFMFILAPWYSWGTGYDTIPTDVRTVLQVYADDESNDHQTAVNDIWNKLPATIERRWQLIRSDACGCGVTAIHTVPMSASQTDTTPKSKYDAFDIWGLHRRVIALAKYAFDKDATARTIAYGDDASMGAWKACGGRAVRPLETSTQPITTTCQALLYPYSKRCDNADPGVCP